MYNIIQVESGFCMIHFIRTYPIFKDSMLILGPCEVGKSTFVREQVLPALTLE